MTVGRHELCLWPKPLKYRWFGFSYRKVPDPIPPPRRITEENMAELRRNQRRGRVGPFRWAKNHMEEGGTWWFDIWVRLPR